MFRARKPSSSSKSPAKRRPASANASTAASFSSPRLARFSSDSSDDDGLQSLLGIFRNLEAARQTPTTPSPQPRGKENEDDDPRSTRLDAPVATAGDVTRRRETSGASTSASEPHRPSRVAVEAGRGKGNPLGAPESVPTLAPDALRLTPSQHWLLHWQQQERTQEKWNEGRNPRRALKRQHEHAERQRASRHPSASLPAVVPQDGLNHPGHEASPPVKSSITVGWSEAEHAEGRSITAGDDGDANDGTRRLPRSSDVAARVLRHQSALNLSPTPAPLGLLTPMRSPWESCAVENDSGSSDPSGALDPFRSIFMAAMADTPEFSTVTPSPAGNSATLSRVSAAGQSASAVSTLDALDTLERVCIALQGVEDREAAVARRSGIDAGGSLRRTWALARTSETRVAWARDDALSRSSTPQLQLPHGGRHSFHSRGAEEVVRQVLTGL